ncbi:hypothetical protein BKA70DRAFT_1418601 [Coprinopsis sp. MPI-PUGE-AT-0042]|nr:hypothetical protein BKA70DRAFT_1418601 [Coprinopsis sp. MPI-PUGE-AT-0042]
MSRSMFDSGKGGIQINGGTFNDVGRDQHNTYNHQDNYDFRAGSNPQMHHYRPGTRVNHGPVTNISHAGNLNLGTNYGSLIQNSGGSYSSPPPPPPRGHYYPPPYPPMGYDGDPGYWYPHPGMPPYGMTPPWAQAPYSQPPTPHNGYSYPGDDDETGSYTRSSQSRNPYYRAAPANPRPPPKGQENNPFRNLDRSRPAPLREEELGYASQEDPYRPQPNPRRRTEPSVDGVDVQMAGLNIDNDRRRAASESSDGQTPPRGSPRRTRCETVDDEDGPRFSNTSSAFGLRR